MTDIRVIHVGEFKESFFREAYAEYVKRISAFCRFTDVCIKEEKITDEKSAPLIARALEKESDAILAAIPKNLFVVSLCVEGGLMSSPDFSELIQNKAAENGGIVFIIGSSHGLAKSVKAASGLRLSFSEMTLPHQLMRVVLAEQIYRGFAIAAGKNYHK